MISPTIPLLIWPLVALVIMGARGMSSGVIWVVVLGYLFLPDNFSVDLPAVPPYGKDSAIALGLVLGVLFLARRTEDEKPVYTDRLSNAVFLILVFLLVVAPVGTFLDNRYILINGPTVRSALSFRDVISSLNDVALVLVPYYVGRRWLATPEQHTRFLTVLVIIGLGYSLLAIWEARMSPQLNRTLYGYFPHSWIQHIRGGFRPVIFLDHGLSVGFLLLSVVLASCALSRQTPKMRLFYLLAALWICVVLVLSRNLGATMLALLFAPMVIFITPRMQIRVAMILALIFLSYPALRQAELVKFDGFLNFIGKISLDRAGSLEFRLDNEDALLARALEKPLFGWGGWARQLIYDDRGRNLSVSDGLWIIVLGKDGWIGYIALFGLITAPLFLLGRTVRRKPIEPATAGLAAITAANLVYLIPNSTLTALGWMGFGALAGYVQFDMSRKRAPGEVPASGAATGNGNDTARPGPRYTRFGPDSEPTRETRPAAPLTRHLRVAPSFRR